MTEILILILGGKIQNAKRILEYLSYFNYVVRCANSKYWNSTKHKMDVTIGIAISLALILL